MKKGESKVQFLDLSAVYTAERFVLQKFFLILKILGLKSRAGYNGERTVCTLNQSSKLMIWRNIPPGPFISFSARNPVKFEFLVGFHFLDLSYDV